MKTRLLCLVILLISLSLSSQSDPISVDIPMTDGKFLAGDLYLPNDTDEFPTILIMTPYGKFFYAINGLPLGVGENISESNYAFLVVDWRCRFASLSACAVGSDNGDDGYDVVEWIAEQNWSDGKVGMWGPSALGNIQFATAEKKPPHLTCCVPEVSGPHITFKSYFPGGALITERFETLTILFPGAFNLVIQNPFYNLLWEIVENNTFSPEEIEVPLLLIGGWYDHNIDQTIYMSDSLSKVSPVADQHKTLIGPWVHGGSGQAFVGSLLQGELTYPDAEGENISAALEFFDFHMRNVLNDWDKKKRYTYFQMGDNSWYEGDTWPALSNAEQTLYFHEDNTLQGTFPTSSSASMSYSYDPEDPSPTVGGKTLNLDLDQGPYDQKDIVESRSDILSFTSNPLNNDLVVQGKIKINLYVSSDRLDTDFAVRLTDVYPDERSMLLSDQIQRMRFRNGYRSNEVSLINPGEIYPVELILEDLAITFRKDHQIRVLVSSSNYPRYNRNMNTGGEMYPDNNIDTLVNPLIAENSIQVNSNYPSSISLPVDMVSADNSLSLYDIDIKILPNPADSYIHVSAESEMRSIRITHLTGSTILDNPLFSNDVVLDVDHLTSGLYIVTIILKSGQQISKPLLIAR